MNKPCAVPIGTTQHTERDKRVLVDVVAVFAANRPKRGELDGDIACV
eukprot:COSAG02_NODE_32094_length_522_cov_1.096927_1_plen_46_part_01